MHKNVQRETNKTWVVGFEHVKNVVNKPIVLDGGISY